MKLTLDEKSMDAILWWIDAAYGIHKYLKGHPSGMMPFVKGAAARKSSKHRINSRSSTKSKIIVVGDHMIGVLWILRFIGGNGSR